MLSVKGRNRVPRPAAKIMAFILAYSHISTLNFGLKRLFNILFSMYQVHLHAELLVQMFRQVLCRVHGAVLSAGAAEADRQIGEAAFHVALHGSVDKGVGMLQEYGYLAVVFQEADNGFVQSREGFVTLVLAKLVTFTTRRRFCRSSVNCFRSVSSRRIRQR